MKNILTDKNDNYDYNQQGIRVYVSGLYKLKNRSSLVLFLLLPFNCNIVEFAGTGKYTVKPDDKTIVIEMDTVSIRTIEIDICYFYSG